MSKNSQNRRPDESQDLQLQKPKNSGIHRNDEALSHKVRLTEYLSDNFDLADSNDPVARQYMPSDKEKIPSLLDQADPIGDRKYGVGKILVHRYPDRVLLLATDHCAAYCRFCFRKDRVGKGEAVPEDKDIDQALSYIESNPAIREVIFSGGDPLILSPRRLQDLVSRTQSIPHVKFIRFHSRAPVSDPARITPELAKSITGNKPTYIVIHTNHADELTPQAITAFKNLKDAGAILLSQSVLLRGVNNDAETLANLFYGLVENGIKPYYLHHPDLVEGTAHFQLSLNEGQSLMKELQGKISGLALPTYVLDIPGGYGKIPVNETYITKTHDGHYVVEDINGATHAYPPAAHK